MPDLDDRVLVVVGVGRNERVAQRGLDVRDAGLELRDELAEVAVRPRGVEIAARLLPLLCEPVGLLELLQLSPRGGRLPPVVVDRRVGHSLLRLAVRALELIDKLFDSGHE